jgi:hypothetical protein
MWKLEYNNLDHKQNNLFDNYNKITRLHLEIITTEQKNISLQNNS